MPVQIFNNDFTPLSADKLAQWAKIPPAIAGDVMNRQNVMAGRISPLVTWHDNGRTGTHRQRPRWR